MPNTPHRKKTLRQAERRNVVNRAKRSAMRSSVKQARAAIEADPATADAALAAACKKLDKAAGQNLIHANKANRMKSRLAKSRNNAASAE